ncbi:hypothetical protein Pan258_58320 [Symmachiella dynata]|uniref:AAA family ATPase n=1 Tax=Symmachiella dynata TaxID=2527995 RepID=UPI001187CB53|nr:AAA family ATPase [Symmachiella dynata]QDT51740.1 hypothetical protein Pan258_58320 [Symmachiella dynata]
MTDSSEKLTPAQFLSQLKRDTSSADDSVAADDGGIPNFDDLDFSDLEQTNATEQDESEGDEEQVSAEQNDVEESPRDHQQLNELFERVHTLLGTEHQQEGDVWSPPEPETIEDTGLGFEEIERLVLKYLMARGAAAGRAVATHICIPFQIIDPLLKSLKADKLVIFKNSATMGDYEYTLTDLGRERARRYSEECTYFGSAMVPLQDYLIAMEVQSIAKQEATEENLKEAFSDLIIEQAMLDQLGPAINSGRGMFLFGYPGNGKTSIAERVTGCFGSTIWIPRTLGIDGDIIRLYDPAIHEKVDDDNKSEGILSMSSYDRRWVQIVRPTVVVGGELTMEELEVRQNPANKLCEAPLQLKSNCGTLVIDDFGRQRMSTDELLNRWIVPLEKRYDFLNLPSGKKIQVPFDQLIIFSTNLEPKDLVDEAFLRRIPYKIEATNPSPDMFHQLFELMAPMQGFQYDKGVVDYLIQTHYVETEREMRACHPRDLLLQIRNFCTYKGLPKKMTAEAIDIACSNYFTVM